MTRCTYSTTEGNCRVLLPAETGRKWFAFESPERQLGSHRIEDVVPILQEVEAAGKEGLHAVGFVAYEAASAFDEALVTHRWRSEMPLIWFGIYRERRLIGGRESSGVLEEEGMKPWAPQMDFREHHRRVEQIRSAIARGDTYQVNLTFPMIASDIEEPEPLFQHLMTVQSVPHAAFLDLGRWGVASASPELFFRKEGRRLVTRPMKGTAPRRAGTMEDRAQGRWLRESTKDQAENLMIVDMLRNDLGRIAEPGSVVVRDLHQIERYATVWQMTSTVEAQTDASLSEVFRALFPCASITGAPKASSMKIIRSVEPGSRGVYTGAIGWVGPGSRAEFSVAIRTAVVDRAQRTATYGVGGGIVWDSQPQAEYQEALAKAATLTRPPLPRFELLESLLWRPAGFWLLSQHLDRLAGSVEYFGWEPLELDAIRKALELATAGLSRKSHKVRLLVAQDGSRRIETMPLHRRRSKIWRVGLAVHPISVDPRFVVHKTTFREHYSLARSGGGSDWDDVVLWNDRRELTESTLANLVLEIDGKLKTPAFSAGLLPGVYRQHLLDRGEIEEACLCLEDLERADRIWLINSVRGWLPVEWVSQLRLTEKTSALGTGT